MRSEAKGSLLSGPQPGPECTTPSHLSALAEKQNPVGQGLLGDPTPPRPGQYRPPRGRRQAGPHLPFLPPAPPGPRARLG